MGDEHTLGIDMASQPAGTAACLLAWRDGGGTVVETRLPADDDELVLMAGGADKIGIDVPLGWPRRFAEAVWAHSEGRGWPGDYVHAAHRDEMRFRATDLAVRGERAPLSVASDRIALPAMRAAGLVPRLEGRPVDLSGAGRVVEVYPALALRRWGLPFAGYKGRSGAGARHALVAALLARCPWLEIGEFRMQVEASADRLDALVAALVARAHRRGLCEPIPPQHADDARREGWIAVPLASALERLA